MKLAVNLVTWNGENFLKSCLDSLESQTFKDFSLLIIDNGSTDNTVSFLKENYPQIRVVRHENNVGFAKAHNQAIHWTKSEYVLCLNQDIVLEPNCIERLIQFMDKHSEAGAATAKVLRLQNGEKTNYIDSVGLQIFKNYKVVDIAQGEIDDGKYGMDEEVFGFSGACSILRREALEDVQYEKEFFDEDFFSYQEDIDLSLRMRMRGWQIWRVGQAIAHHARTARNNAVRGEKKTGAWLEILKHRRSKSNLVNFYSYRNHLYLLNKNFVQWRFFFNVLWYEKLKFFYVLIFETKNLRAIKDLIKNFSKLMKKRHRIVRGRCAQMEDLLKWFV
ncbi:glycosyltransferase family 2 protein [Candidatus Falkowbacteria bacterium]|nr:glycosyltransferase family 2 protein [Candidatus Falkowbacteria bacterium]